MKTFYSISIGDKNNCKYNYCFKKYYPVNRKQTTHIFSFMRFAKPQMWRVKKRFILSSLY